MLPNIAVTGDTLLLLLGSLLILSAVAAAGGVAVARLRARRSVGNRLRLAPDRPGATSRTPASRAGSGNETAQGKDAAPLATMLDWAIARAGELVRDGNPTEMKKLRMQLVRAGIFDPRGPAVFLVARLLSAVLGAGSVFAWFVLGSDGEAGNPWIWSTVAGLACYFLPNVALAQRAKRVNQQNRSGFPDLMDLLGVCSNAGLSMEAGLERVARELADLYPVLGVHLQILCLEVRAGRPLEEGLEGLADRTNIAEVRAFATLLQQSKELGSSLSDALRVFSDDMRHKRLSNAEEKAYALPAKMSGVVTACILPAVIFVAILPVIVKYSVD